VLYITAFHGIKEGYEVYGLIDAAGDSTVDAHNFGVKRMLQAGNSHYTGIFSF
jgi:hypothetical protein